MEENMQMVMRSWEDLPDDCWETIFTCLDLHHSHNLRPVSTVSKRFHKLANHARTTFTLPHTSPFPPSHFYARFPNLTSLTIIWRPPHLGHLVRKLADSSLPLRSLSISHQTAFPRVAMRRLGRSYALRRTLTSLECTYFHRLTDDDLLVIADSFSYLRHLSLSCTPHTNKITDEAVGAVSAKLTSLLSFNMWCGRLITGRAFSSLASNCLSLSDINVCVDDAHHSVSLHHFAAFAALSNLHLSHVSISDAGLVQLAGSSLNFRKLNLWLPRCTGNVTGAAICRFLKSCSHLSELWMTDFYLPSDMVALDFAASIPNIRLLHVQNAKNLPENILVDLLHCCPKLEEVAILDTFAAGHVQGSIDLPVVHHRMRQIRLTGWGLTDETLMLFASVCPNLESFDADHCWGITERGIEAMRVGCCKIKHLNVKDCGSVGCYCYLCDHIKRKRKRS